MKSSQSFYEANISNNIRCYPTFIEAMKATKENMCGNQREYYEMHKNLLSQSNIQN